MRCLGWLVLLSLFVSSPLLAQAPGRIQTPTRFVTIFTNLENQLMDKLVAKDREAAAHMLTDDFVQWTPVPPGSPDSKEEWLKPDRSDMADFRIRQVAAQDMGERVAVSFVLTFGVRAFFIVDIWQKSGPEWQLTTRYLAPIDPSPFRGPARPTGKE